MALSYEEFKKEASQLCGTDLFIKSQQMDRRIHSLMSYWEVKDYDEYLNVLKTNPRRFQEFVKRLTINVSEFFRNPDRFMELWERIFARDFAQFRDDPDLVGGLFQWCGTILGRHYLRRS